MRTPDVLEQTRRNGMRWALMIMRGFDEAFTTALSLRPSYSNVIIGPVVTWMDARVFNAVDSVMATNVEVAVLVDTDSERTVS